MYKQKKRIKYYGISLYCIHGGKNFKARGTGVREQRLSICLSTIHPSIYLYKMENTRTTAPQEETFLRLFHYDFQGNSKFLEGWTKIRKLSTNNVKESFIKAQVFFYSRQEEPVDLNDYLTWLQSSGKEVKVIDTATINADYDDREDCKIVTRSENTTTEEQGRTGKHPINFGELIEMMQKGIKLPDIQKLNIEPTNEMPTPAQLNRPKKPWET